MRKILTAMLVFGLFLPLVIGPGATAQEKKGKTPEEQFAALDANKDNKLSKEEYVARITDPEKKGKAETRFSRMDSNNDGFLSLEEFKAGTMKKK
jgi:Ca2+-binding EF-hand superfamily protein